MALLARWRLRGREHALATVCPRAARFRWPLSGDEVEKRADAARPISAGQAILAHVSRSEVTAVTPNGFCR